MRIKFELRDKTDRATSLQNNSLQIFGIALRFLIDV